MSNLAHSIVAKLPNAAPGKITPDEDEFSLAPDEKTKALLAKAKNKRQPFDAFPAKTQPASFPSSRSALNCVAPTGSQESGWVTLQADASKTGLHNQGRWQADLEIATNLSRVLLAQILPTCVKRNVQEFDLIPARAVAFENLWIDVLLHQVENENSALCPLSMLELAAYRVINGDVKMIKSVKSSPMPMEMLSVFTLGYRLKNRKITIDICSDLDRLTTTHIDIDGFSETLPILKLRSGRALPNGIFRAKYRQIVSWSA